MGRTFDRYRFVLGLVIGLIAGVSISAFWPVNEPDHPTEAEPSRSSSLDARPTSSEDFEIPPRIEESVSPAPAVENVATSVRTERAPPETDADVVPDSEIRGRLLAQSGDPIVGARVLAVATSVLAEFPLAAIAPEEFATPEHDGAVASTRQGGFFGLFGLVPGAEYHFYGDVRRAEPCVLLAGAARLGSAIAPAADLDLVDTSRWLTLVFELDAELTTLAEVDPNARITAQITRRDQRSSTWTSFPLRSRPALRVVAGSPIDFSFSGDAIAPRELRGVTLTAGEFERTSLVSLRGWGEGNRVRIVVEDETGARLDRAAVSILPGKDVEPPHGVRAPAATEARLVNLANGVVVHENVRPGPATVFIAAPLAHALAPYSATIEMPERGEVVHVARLVRGGSLIVRVTEAALPMRAIEIVRDAQGDPSAHVGFVDPSGNLATGVVVPVEPRDFRNGHAIAPGEYAVKWLRKPARVERKPFRIVAGETTTVTIP